MSKMLVSTQQIVSRRLTTLVGQQCSFFLLILPLLHILLILFVHKANLLSVDEDATNAEEASIDVEESSVDVDKASIDVEEATVDVEEASINVEETSVDAEDAAVNANKAAVEDLLFLAMEAPSIKRLHIGGDEGHLVLHGGGRVTEYCKRVAIALPTVQR